MRGSYHIIAITTGLSLLTLTACDSGSSMNVSCPGWAVGDTMNYVKFVTNASGTSENNTNLVVMEHTDSLITLAVDDIGVNTFSIVNNQYIPESANDTITSVSFTSDTPICPPPSVGQSYSFDVSSSFFDPISGGGTSTTSYTMTVTEVTEEDLVVPAGEFRVKKILMDKTTDVPYSTVTRYYAGEIGIVKEVEAFAAYDSTITKELTSYSYAE